MCKSKKEKKNLQMKMPTKYVTALCAKPITKEKKVI